MSRPRDFLGPYRLVRLIRVGHTCQVWEAAKTDDTTRYVLKVLRPEVSGVAPSVSSRTVRSAAAVRPVI